MTQKLITLGFNPLVNSLAISVPDSAGKSRPAKWSKPTETGVPVPSTSISNKSFICEGCKVLKSMPSKVLRRGALPPVTVAGSELRKSVNWLDYRTSIS